MHFRVKNILKINHNYIPKYPKYNWFNFLVFLLSVQIILVTRFIFNIVYLFLVVKVMLLRIIQPWRDECSKFRHLNAEGYLFLTHLHSFFYFFFIFEVVFFKKVYRSCCWKQCNCWKTFTRNFNTQFWMRSLSPLFITNNKLV
jgi:hypothetical protein